MHMCIGTCILAVTMWINFEGGVCWDELTETCSDILRAVGFQGNIIRMQIIVMKFTVQD